MSFPYANRAMHLLDTPGHKDFSEDTYRALTAVESVLISMDSLHSTHTTLLGVVARLLLLTMQTAHGMALATSYLAPHLQ